MINMFTWYRRMLNRDKIEIGDLVQVEIAGAFVLEKPSRVTDIMYFLYEKYIFIEGSDSAVEASKVFLVKKGY